MRIELDTGQLIPRALLPLFVFSLHSAAACLGVRVSSVSSLAIACLASAAVGAALGMGLRSVLGMASWISADAISCASNLSGVRNPGLVEEPLGSQHPFLRPSARCAQTPG